MNQSDKQTAIECIRQIPPASLDYQGWLNVGMALQHAGCSVADFDSWSQPDPRYKKGDCARKWSSFRSSTKPVTVASLVKMCRDRGGKIISTTYTEEHKELGWNDTIGGGRIKGEHEPEQIIDTNYIQDEDIKEPDNWNPVAELTNYLSLLFNAEDHVGYATESWQDAEGHHFPKAGNFDRTAGQLIQELSKCNGDIGRVIGDWNKECGGWVRFNALDGKGIRDENVTNFKHCLVESDEISIGKAYAIYKELELPITCLVHSGGKSLHALCRVDAKDAAEFRTRVDFLYNICGKNGLEIDKQNRNASRLSRLPGLTRNGKKQFLVATNLGKRSFDEWKNHIEEAMDDLPDFDALADWWDHMPDLAPCLIEGILRQGHKLLLTGPSKAGKSFLLIYLTIAIAEALKWLGWQCKGGKIVYVNLELDRASCLHRFKAVYNALGIMPNNLQNITIWNLRGKSQAMDKLAPRLIRRVREKGYTAIIIDPIYKVITGDENKASEMASFCNNFDRIAMESGASIISCHHHSKGDQGAKKAQDRGSGSGVFSRDPDAVLDMVELMIGDPRRKTIIDRFTADALMKYLAIHYPNSITDIGQDDQLIPEKIVKAYPHKDVQDVSVSMREYAAKISGWRIEGILREFPELDKKEIFFAYPIHTVDKFGLLKDAHIAGELKTQKEVIEETRQETINSTLSTLSFLYDEKRNITIEMLCEHLGCTDKAARTRLKQAKIDLVKGKGIIKYAPEGKVFSRMPVADNDSPATETVRETPEREHPADEIRQGFDVGDF